MMLDTKPYTLKHLSADRFPSGAMITSGAHDSVNRVILYVNRYIEDVFGYQAEQLVGQYLSTILTKASSIMLESYLVPMLTHTQRAEELLIEIKHANGNKMPVIANTMYYEDEQELIYWSITDARQRNKLYDQLIETRRQLEEKAHLLEYLSITDELTGLINRRELEKRAGIMLAQARRQQQSVALLVLDVDHFKRVNDQYGHAAGDGVLKKLGSMLKQYGRESDIIARCGGEEFVMLIPNADASSAHAVAKRIHELVKEISVDGHALTLSIGLVHVSAADTLHYPTLFKMADQALYEAKAAGRNCTIEFKL